MKTKLQKDLCDATEALLSVAIEQLDQSATHKGLTNCTLIANAKAALWAIWRDGAQMCPESTRSPAKEDELK